MENYYNLFNKMEMLEEVHLEKIDKKFLIKSNNNDNNYNNNNNI